MSSSAAPSVNLPWIRISDMISRNEEVCEVKPYTLWESSETVTRSLVRIWSFMELDIAPIKIITNVQEAINDAAKDFDKRY